MEPPRSGPGEGVTPRTDQNNQINKVLISVLASVLMVVSLGAWWDLHERKTTSMPPSGVLDTSSSSIPIAADTGVDSQQSDVEATTSNILQPEARPQNVTSGSLFRQCLENTRDVQAAKDCCDCLDADVFVRKACRDAAATYDFSVNTEFKTFDIPSTLGRNGDYSAYTASGDEQQCKQMCDSSPTLACGDFQYCRTACDNTHEKENGVPQPTVVTPVESSENFSFAVEADPHMDEQSDALIYKQTLQNISSAKPAFLVDLGDIFMVDKLADKSEANIRARYTLMKSFYDLLPATIPLHFVMGNHDGEAGWDSLNTKSYRQEYFPNETYDKNYYSFNHGNALFIVLDPYTYTMIKPNADGWLWTLGKAQYDWLRLVLENNTARYKFVFIHQLVGGENQGRGGVEFAGLYEWGGNNTDGSYGFDAQRPGWGTPIHQLLVDHGVNAVFKGHDHFYSKQELDGIIYQTVSQPSHPGDKINTAETYGYVGGETIGGSGYVRVQVLTSTVTVEFVRYDGKVLDSYALR